MTRSEIKTLVLHWLDDPNGTYFTDTLLNTWIDLAQREVQKRLVLAGESYYVKPVETLTVASQADYVLPTDFIALHRVEYIVSGTAPNEVVIPLKFITLNQKDNVSQGLGTPTVYYMKKDRIVLLQTPDSTNKVLRIWYSPMVANIASNSDDPDVPEHFQELVAILAAENGFIKDDRVKSNLDSKKKGYEEMLEQMKEERAQDQSRQVIVTNDYESGIVF